MKNIKANSLTDLTRKINNWIAMGNTLDHLQIFEDDRKVDLYEAHLNNGVADLPKSIRDIRMQSGYTQEYMSQALDMSGMMISYRERQGTFSRTDCLVMGDLFGVEYEFLYELNRKQYTRAQLREGEKQL